MLFSATRSASENLPGSYYLGMRSRPGEKTERDLFRDGHEDLEAVPPATLAAIRRWSLRSPAG